MLDSQDEQGAYARRIMTWLDGVCRRPSDSAESLWRRRVVLGFSVTQIALMAGLAATVDTLVATTALMAVLAWYCMVLKSLWSGAADRHCAHQALIGMALYGLVAWYSTGDIPLGGLLALLLCSFCLLGWQVIYPWLVLLLLSGAMMAFTGPMDAMLRLNPFDGLALLSALFTVALYAHCGSLLAQDFQSAERERAGGQLEDSLTRLLNRQGLAVRLDDALEHARRNGTLVGAAMIRLDQWLQWEHTGAGATILLDMAARIRSGLRQTDFAAYLGGGEFVLILCNLKGRRGMETVIQRMQPMLAEPVVLPAGRHDMRVTLGAALYPFDAESAEDLLDGARVDGDKLRGQSPESLLHAAG